MEFFRYFFRGTSDGYIFPLFSPIHFFLLSVIVASAILLYSHKENLKESKHSKMLKIFIASILFLQQSIMYLWYGFSSYFKLSESLPLYNCRVAIILLIIGLIFNVKLFKTIGVYWGITGSILALLMPNVDPFSFPHYTLFSYFIGHGFLLLAGLYLLFVEDFAVDLQSLISCLWFTNFYHLGVLIFNKWSASNYCYLIAPPFFQSFFAEGLLNQLYVFIIFLFFNLVMVLFYLSFRGFSLLNVFRKNIFLSD